MKVFTTRSGVVLHGSALCPDLRHKRIFVLDDSDALPHAVRCSHHRGCAAVFVRQEARAA